MRVNHGHPCSQNTNTHKVNITLNFEEISKAGVTLYLGMIGAQLILYTSSLQTQDPQVLSNKTAFVAFRGWQDDLTGKDGFCQACCPELVARAHMVESGLHKVVP